MTERRDLPLFTWAARQPAVGGRRRRARPLPARSRLLLLAAGGSALLVLPLLWRPLPRLVWNASASAPLGLYAISPGTAARSGDWVVARAPTAARELAARRHYLPATVLLVKQVAAITGAQVCATGAAIRIDGRQVAARRTVDRAGRPLPWWQGCRTLAPGELFLLNAGVPASFDGRYFGVSAASDVIGTARLLWAR